MELLNDENENLKKKQQPKFEDSQNKFETVNQASSVKWLTKPVLSTFQHAHSITVVLFTMYRQTLIKLCQKEKCLMWRFNICQFQHFNQQNKCKT